jgi:hypothetical protein
MMMSSATLTVLLTAAALVAVPIERGSAAAASQVSASGGLVSPATALTFTNRTRANSNLGDNYLFGVYAVDDTVYAATGGGGLSISTDGGATFTNRTFANSNLGSSGNYVYGVYAVGSTVYAGTDPGLSTSINGGGTFTTSGVGLGINPNVYGVYIVDDTLYAATDSGLAISTDGGVSFDNRTTSNTNGGGASGLGDNYVPGVYAIGSTVYAATAGGLAISIDGGVSFDNRTTSNTNGGGASGLGSNNVRAVYAIGSTVYAATGGGLSISTDGGATFTNRTVANSNLGSRDNLGSNDVYGVFAVGTTVYAATSPVSVGDSFVGGGLSISTDGGATFTNYTTANGLGSNAVSGVHAVGSTVYAATGNGLSIGVPPPALQASPNLSSVVAGATGTVTISSTALPLPDDTVVTAVSADTSVATVTSTFNASGGDAVFTVTGVSAGTVNVTFSATGYTDVVVAVTVSAPAPSPGPAPVSAPSAPLSVSGVAGDGSVLLSWGAPVTPGSFPVSNFQAVVSPGGQSCLVSVPTASCTISGLTNGTTYTATVRALNGAGWSPDSTPSAAFTPEAPAPPPTPTITITGTRGDVNGRPGVIVSGTTTDLDMGAVLRPWVRFPGQPAYTQGAGRILVSQDGTFTWQRRTGKRMYVIIKTEDGVISSNRLAIRAS